jgi:alkyl hydroperoxide reductase subunit AhpF
MLARGRDCDWHEFEIVLAKGKEMAAEQNYDAMVIGAGQGGKPLSIVLARAGLKTAVVEETYVGGTCVNYG